MPTVAAPSDVPVLAGEQWSVPVTESWGVVQNPSTGETIARVPMCGAKEVDAVVRAARLAFESWSRVPAPVRASKLFAFKSQLESHFDELAALVTRENGKTLDEARGDVRRGIEVAAAIDQLVIDDTSANPRAEMGPVIDAAARSRIHQTIDRGSSEGAKLVRGGSNPIRDRGHFVAPTLFEQARPEMSIAQEELFGPVLTMLHPRDLNEAIAWTNRGTFGNGAVLFTSSGGAARQFTREIACGMVGINVGVPAPMAVFAFSGWNRSFFGDLHVQGLEGILFYTRQKIVLSRWDNTYWREQGW